MIGSFESNKDIVQELTESAAHRVGNIATIITDAVKDVTKEIGDWITDGIEMRDAARAARNDDGIVDAETVNLDDETVTH